MSSSRIDAERALLGAVLADPPAHHQLLDLVEAEDFERPWHAQVLAAMQRVRGRGLPDAVAVYHELQKDADLPAAVARDGVLLADLIEASPRPGHARAYAAMVVEGGIRQRLDLAGARLVQASECDDLGVALHQAAQTSVVIDACKTRWAALPDAVRNQLPEVPRGQLVRQLRIAPRGTRAGARTALLTSDSSVARSRRPRALAVTARQYHAIAGQEMEPDRSQLSDEVCGVRALRDLVADPSQITLVRGWLRAEHFARREHGQIWAVLRDLHAYGQPVDQLTVSWEAGRRGLIADPTSLSGGTGAFAAASAWDVYRRGNLAAVERAGLGIQVDAADAAKCPPKLLKTAAARISALQPELSQNRELPPGEMINRSPQRHHHLALQPDREAEK